MVIKCLCSRAQGRTLSMLGTKGSQKQLVARKRAQQSRPQLPMLLPGQRHDVARPWGREETQNCAIFRIDRGAFRRPVPNARICLGHVENDISL
jgi:hypothetical protein